MRVAVKKIFEVEQSKGKHTLQVRSELKTAKKEGTIFFSKDVSSLSEKEEINLYFYQSPGNDKTDRAAFPIPKEEYILPKGEKARFEYLKTHFESYYPDTEMDYNIFLSFDTKPFHAENYIWFSSSQD